MILATQDEIYGLTSLKSSLPLGRLFCCFLLLGLCFCLWTNAQTVDGYSSSDIFYLPKISTHQALPGTDFFVEIANRKRVPPPQAEYPDYISRLKALANQAKKETPFSPSISSRELAPSPEMLAGFHGNDYNGAHPNDNHIAISTSGKIVSLTNSQICVYATDGALLKKSSLQAFADTIGTGASKYDPRVLYHPQADRFVVIFLSGRNSVNSRLVLAFSATAAPEGAWHLYSLPGNMPGLGAAVYADYPQIGFSASELFISLNLFGDNDDLFGAGIWQIAADKGFAGDSLLLKTHSLPGKHSLCPITSMAQPSADNFYFIRKSQLQHADDFTFYEIRTPLSNGGLMASPVTLGAGTNYYLSPDNSQKGSLQLLNNGDSRLQAAYRIDSSCYFVLSTRAQNRPAIYLGQLKLHPNGLSQSQLTASVIAHDSLELAFPNLTYAGYCSASGKHAHAITFNYSSPFHYPGNGLVYVDTSGRVSDFSLNQQSHGPTGTGDINQPFRWGDYTGIASRWPGEIWTSGYYIRSDGLNSSWLSQIKVGNNPLLNLHETQQDRDIPFLLYPNPAKDRFQLQVNIEKADVYHVRLLNLQGRQVAQLFHDKLWPGKAELRFDTYMLQPGVYFVEIRGNEFRGLQKLLVF